MRAASDPGSYLAELRGAIEPALMRALDVRGIPPVIAGPLTYALLAPGKRLRPCLTLAVADAVADAHGTSRTIARSMVLPAACAVEMIHCYSLVHDDLPAMDNDALRRGRPTTHVVYGDGLAILAGDGLLTDAFAILADEPPSPPAAGAPNVPADRRLRAIAVLARAAGSRGMVGGQAIDLAAVGRIGVDATALDAAALEDMHLRKTGALIRAACVIGAILTGASDVVVDAVDEFARELGLAFQIVDDLLDVQGAAVTLGKTAGKDAAAGKPTFAALHGIEPSRRMAEACVTRALAALDRASLTGKLGDIAVWSLQRSH